VSATVEIIRTPDVFHGKPRIEGTRVGVFALGVAAEHGASVADLCREYPNLDRSQIEAALGYYERHPNGMATLCAQRDSTAARIREQSRASE
jgi:uncharacterized protein (DUF433 family)